MTCQGAARVLALRGKQRSISLQNCFTFWAYQEGLWSFPKFENFCIYLKFLQFQVLRVHGVCIRRFRILTKVLILNGTEFRFFTILPLLYSNLFWDGVPSLAKLKPTKLASARHTLFSYPLRFASLCLSLRVTRIFTSPSTFSVSIPYYSS